MWYLRIVKRKRPLTQTIGGRRCQSGHLMVSDYRRPQPRATPEELQMRCLPLRWIGPQSPALPDAKRSGIKPLFHAGFKCSGR